MAQITRKPLPPLPDKRSPTSSGSTVSLPNDSLETTPLLRTPLTDQFGTMNGHNISQDEAPTPTNEHPPGRLYLDEQGVAHLRPETPEHAQGLRAAIHEVGVALRNRAKSICPTASRLKIVGIIAIFVLGVVIMVWESLRLIKLPLWFYGIVIGIPVFVVAIIGVSIRARTRSAYLHAP